MQQYYPFWAMVFFITRIKTLPLFIFLCLLNFNVSVSAFSYEGVLLPKTGSEDFVFTTILQNPDEVVTCPNDGRTLVKYFLCGTNDIRNLTLSQTGTVYQWQRLDPNTCAASVIADCPTTSPACTWNTVGNEATYSLSAPGEYRVSVDSGVYYYFKVTQNPLNPQLIGQDIICGSTGRVEITNVPSGYEYSNVGPAGPYQADPFFDILTPGDYQVWVRLIGGAASSCIFPSNTVSIQSLDLSIEATLTDINCVGELGSIEVNASGAPGFYIYRLVRGGVTVDTYGPTSNATYTFSNIGSGTYTVAVQTNDCDQSTSVDTLGNPLTIGSGVSALTVDANASSSFGCGATSVPIAISVSGGTAPYVYSIDGGNTFSAPFVGNTSVNVNISGTYTVMVNDANGCQHTASVDVEDIPPPLFSISSFSASCGGANNGMLRFEVSNGFGYTLVYSIDGGSTFQTNNVFPNLAAGSYSVTIRYSQNGFTCMTPVQNEVVGTPTAITGIANIVSSPNCLNPNGGAITITGVGGGTAPYEYNLGAGFVSSNSFSGLGVGTYTPVIRDANGCVQSLAPITFSPLNQPNDIDFSISNVNCTSGTATITLSVAGGTAPYTYQIIQPTASAVNNGTNHVFNNIGLGTYTFRVTDNLGCTYEENFALNNLGSLASTAQQLNPITCFGDTNGAGRVLVSGFVTTYQYQVDANPPVTGQTNGVVNFTNLAAGSYSIVITDESTNCTSATTLVIDGPTAPLNINSLNVVAMSCQNNNRGLVTINTAGGWGGNRYRLIRPDGTTLGPKSGNTFSNLNQEGTYTVMVTDANGCTVSDSFTLSAVQSPSLTLDSASSDFCYDPIDAATLVVSASLGLPPYEYRINNSAWGTSNTFSNLTPGNHTLQVRDANLCTDEITVSVAPQLIADATLVRPLDCSGIDGEIEVTMLHGYPSAGNYDSYDVFINGVLTAGAIAITGNSFTYFIPNDGSITTTAAYHFVVRDSRGCTNQSNTVLVEPQESISGSVLVTHTICGDNTSGQVALVPDTAYGIPPYQYSQDGGATWTTQSVFAGLGAGTYTNFVIRDSRGCQSPPLSATIAASAPIDANLVANAAVCSSGTVLGSLVNNVTNGTAPFIYEVYDQSNTLVATIGPTGTTNVTFPNLEQGTYTVITTDALGCRDVDQIALTQNQLDLIPLDAPPPSCTGAWLSYRVQAVGGTAPYEFRLVGEPTFVLANVNGVDIHDFSYAMQFGITLFVEVRDANGCVYLEQIDPVIAPDPIDINITATSPACGSGFGGAIQYEIINITPSPATFTVTLQNTDTGAIVFTQNYTNETIPFYGSITNLPLGSYQIIVEDANTQCSASARTTLAEDSPQIAIANNIAATCNSEAQVIVTTSGGTAPYQYAYVPIGDPVPSVFVATNSFIIAAPYPADYDFYVRDANGCLDLVTTTVNSFGDIPTPAVDVINQCFATSNFQINITAPLSTGSGLAHETFEYDLGGGFQSSPNFIVPNAGTYTIRIRNGLGCTTSIMAEVFDFFSISANASTQPTCNSGDGVISVSTTGGSGNFEYQLRDAALNPIGPPQSSPIFTSILPGDYNILVTDLSSNTSPLCSDIALVSVVLATTPIIDSVIANDISCSGANDGSVLVSLLPGTEVDSPITYTLLEAGTANIVSGPQNNPMFENLTQGTYEVLVSNARNCEVLSNSVWVQEPTALQLALSITPFSCNSNGSSFNVTQLQAYVDTNGDGSGTPTGTGPYTYSLNDGTPLYDGTNFQISNSFEIVDTGASQTLVVIARDTNGCQTSSTLVLNPPSDITFSFNINPITCDASGSGVNPGAIEVIIDQGPGDYSVELLPLGTSTAINTLGSDRVLWPVTAPGDYLFGVTDHGSGGCTYITPMVNVPDFNTIIASIAEVRPVTCYGGNDGEISIEINGYVGQYHYEVYTRDNNGVDTNTGVSGTYDTTIPSQNPGVISGVPAGNLIVYVEAIDAPYCDVMSNLATVRSPDRPLQIDFVQTAPVTCNIPRQGAISLSAEGGWGGYQFRITAPNGLLIQDFPSTNTDFSNLEAGVYSIAVRDLEGCEIISTATLADPVPINAQIRIVNDLQCFNDNNGSIEVYNITGGEGAGNYLFQLNRLTNGTQSGLQTTPDFYNLPYGDYSITVFDGWNCSFTTPPITIQNPPVVQASLIELQPPGCGNLGVMELEITNPIAGLSYAYRPVGSTDPFIDFGSGITQIQISVDINVTPGPFQYEVQSLNGCPSERSNQISLDPASPLVIDLDLTNATINCAGEATGIIRAQAFGGIGNYQYWLLSDNNVPTAANTIRPNQNSGIFRNLAPGVYYVYAQSGTCEAVSPPIVIEPKPPLILEGLDVVNVSCNGLEDGQIILEVSGGTGRIRYSISDTLSEFFEGDDPANPNRKTFEGLSPRSYDVIIQDELGCTITQTITISEPQELISSVIEVTPETCLNANNGIARIRILGGTAPYYTSLDSNNPLDFVLDDDFVFENLIGGQTHVVFVRDANGCETNITFDVPLGVDLQAVPRVSYGCEGIFPYSTTEIEITDSSLLPNLLFSLDVDDLSQATEQRVFGDLPAGEHTIYVYHANGCMVMETFVIEAYEPLVLEASKTADNEITAIATGGYGDYEFFFQGQSYGSQNQFYLLEDSSVQILVRDRLGCEALLLMPFDFTATPDFPNFFTPDGDGLNDHWQARNAELFPNLEVKIYDRYGRVVVHLKEVIKWNGTYDGRALPTGDYWYVVNANDADKQQFVGHFTLYR